MSKHSTKPWPKQSFFLSNELIDALSREEMEATWKAMHELGIAKPPYESFDLLLPLAQVLTFKGMNALEEEIESDKYAFIKTDGVVQSTAKPITLRIEGDKAKWLFRGKIPLKERLDLIAGLDTQRDIEMAECAVEWLQVLIILLGTRNIVKETVHRKSVRLGIGGKEKHEYTTTLKIGRITEHTGNSNISTGITLRAHLRRGHIRRQHYGPKNEYIKQIWIPPVFVNADEEWIGERTAYNVSLAVGNSQSTTDRPQEKL